MNRRHAGFDFQLGILTAFLLSACGPTSLPSQELVFPGEAWAKSTPEQEGIDPAAIDALVQDIREGTYGLIDHFTLIRHGRMVADYHFEQDYESIAAAYDTTNHQYNYDHPEWHPYYRDTDLHTLQSVTKSVTSVALGIAVDQGLIPGVEVPALSFFDAYDPDLSDPRKGDMSLEDLLTMRSGIEWSEDTPYTDPNNSCILMEASQEWVPFVLGYPMDADPGTTWEYNSGASVLLGKIVDVATGKRIDTWAKEELFDPLGIDEFYWKTTPSGEVDTEGGLYLSAQDLARIGYLFLRGGMWGDQRIVSEEWVRASTAPVVSDIAPENGRSDPGYGYQWWVPDHDGEHTLVFAGNGYGGQFLLVAPHYDVVAVFNGWNIHGGARASTWRALQERIIPAIGIPQLMSPTSFLFIPDISGFTEFVNQTEISHSRHVISELLEVIIASDTLGMTVTEIEGDAVVFFLPDRKPSLGEVAGQARKTFEAFHTHLKRYERDRICPCGACQTAHRLSLKTVAHAGDIETLRVQEFEKPYGSDVILAHRLLKNEVKDTEYLLVTGGIEGEEGLPDWVTLVPGATTYEALGEIKYKHIPLGPLRAEVPDPPDRDAPPRSERPISKEALVPLSLDETFELISNFDQRLLWTRGVEKLVFDPNRVNRVGTRHQCVIDGDFIDFETVTGDFGPQRLVYGERILAKTPVLDPTLYYILEETDGGTRVCTEVHYRPKPFPKSLLAILFRLGFAKRLSKSLETLAAVGANQSASTLG